MYFVFIYDVADNNGTYVIYNIKAVLMGFQKACDLAPAAVIESISFIYTKPNSAADNTGTDVVHIG